MFTKTMIAISAALALSVACASFANAEPVNKKQQVQPYNGFEKLWFSMPVGEEG